MNDEVITFSDVMPDNTIIFSQDIEPGDRLIKRGRFFYAGTHKGRTYGSNELKKICDNWNPEGIPLQLGHSRSTKDTIGYARNPQVIGGTEIQGDVEILGRDNVEKARLGLWKKLSMGLTLKNMVPEHLAVESFPCLEKATMFNDKTEKGDENKMADETINFQAELEKTRAEFEKAKQQLAEFAQVKERMATMEAESAKLVDQLRFAEDEKLIETFCQPDARGQIKTTPAMRDLELELYHSLDDKQREIFSKYKSAQPPCVDTRVYNSQKHLKPGEQSDEEATAQAKRMAGKA